METIKLNQIVIVDNKYKCKVIDIIVENGVTYYEVKPIEFNSFTRHITIEHLF